MSAALVLLAFIIPLVVIAMFLLQIAMDLKSIARDIHKISITIENPPVMEFRSAKDESKEYDPSSGYV